MDSEWLRRFALPGTQPHRDAVQLFCLPHAGGSASAFVPLARLLAPAVDVLAAQYPGRQDRRGEPAVEDIAALADILAEEVHRQATAPYALFGHSMGALLAYEVARRLTVHPSTGPATVILSGRGTPGERPSPHDRLGTDHEILRAVRHLGGATAHVLDDPELRAMAMPALRADYRALSSYVWAPSPPLTVPLAVLVGDDDPVVTVAQAEAWRTFTTAPTQLHVFSGGHFFLETHLPQVARTVETVLLPLRSPSDGTAPRTLQEK
ncbi:thioesterase II family protein [Streptomyces sp. NBC_01304]|uniref:thioesterase II family protein n=1 Tax=Streptomyces sp. NBC_01304 TaxID=2903818 RepID=UPI002E112650|nr:alpha/beta fold hydrolase [Streptomyces sp. NBC_01304]